MPTNDYLPYLQHHGILGMKWGVRRYQNADGSLTGAGRRRYSRMSDKKLEKSLKKQIHNQRGKLHGFSNRWGHKNIGPRSEKEQQLQEKLYEKELSKTGLSEKRQKLFDLQSHWEDYIDSPEQEKEYEAAEQKLLKETEKIDSIDEKYGRVRVIGKPYAKDFINGPGARLSIAKLMDLGYNKKTSEEFVSRLAKSNRTIGGY